MKFGLKEADYQYITDTVVNPLKQRGLSVYCFGSRARGDHKPFSDLDLMIEGPVSDQVQQLKGAIEESLSKENFPYKVDLVLFEEYADSYKASYRQDRTAW